MAIKGIPQIRTYRNSRGRALLSGRVLLLGCACGGPYAHTVHIGHRTSCLEVCASRYVLFGACMRSLVHTPRCVQPLGALLSTFFRTQGIGTFVSLIILFLVLTNTAMVELLLTTIEILVLGLIYQKALKLFITLIFPNPIFYIRWSNMPFVFLYLSNFNSIIELPSFLFSLTLVLASNPIQSICYKFYCFFFPIYSEITIFFLVSLSDHFET